MSNKSRTQRVQDGSRITHLNAAERNLLEQAKEEIKKLSVPNTVLFFQADPLDLLAVIGLVQLALRHPGIPSGSFTREAGMRFILSVRRQLCNDDPKSAIYKTIEAGFDAADTATLGGADNS